MRGLGLPGWALGVTVPTSTKPKPIAAKASMQRAFLSRPAARPTRFGKLQACERDRIVDARRCIGAGQRRVLRARQRVERQLMGVLGIEAEEEGAGKPVKRGGQEQGHRIILDFNQPRILPDDFTRSRTALTQDELKALVGQAALEYVVKGEIVGVGTGSTVNKFIDALATIKGDIRGAVSSSVASTERLRALGIPVFDSNEVEELAVYIDGADEIDGRGYMIKGGGAALTREKIVAAQSQALRLHRRRVQAGQHAGRASRCRSK